MSPRHTFGLKADVKDNVHYLDEQTVLYPAGHNVVIFNTEQKTQRFISGTEKTEGITAIAVSPNKKYVAVAERAAEGEKALVTVFDLHTLKRRKVLQAVASDVMSREFVCLAFSPDSKGLLTHGGAPDWTLVYWLWEKAKVGAVSKSSNAQNAVYQVSFNPVDNTVVCVTGDGICRFLRITDQTLKPLPGAMGKREPQAYLCHAWMCAAAPRRLAPSPLAPRPSPHPRPAPRPSPRTATERPRTAASCRAPQEPQHRGGRCPSTPLHGLARPQHGLARPHTVVCRAPPLPPYRPPPPPPPPSGRRSASWWPPTRATCCCSRRESSSARSRPRPPTARASTPSSPTPRASYAAQARHSEGAIVRAACAAQARVARVRVRAACAAQASPHAHRPTGPQRPTGHGPQAPGHGP